MAKAPQLTFDSDVPRPQTRAGGGNPVRALIKQALEQLPLDQSYHVPATEDVPEPAKFYSHMVVGENSRFVKHAIDGGKGEIKHFTLKAVDASDKRGAGARLFRVANLNSRTSARARRSERVGAGHAASEQSGERSTTLAPRALKLRRKPSDAFRKRWSK